MLFSELVEAAKDNRLVGQLLSIKRCFGGHADIGIVTTGINTDYCATIAELVAKGHVPSGLEWMDPFFAAIPRISPESCTDDFAVIPSKYPDNPPCPYDVARCEQEAARARCKAKRDEVHKQERKSKMEIILNLTDREIALLRSSTSDFGSSDVANTSLQLKIANAILDAKRDAK